jgi:hypothetical protein
MRSFIPLPGHPSRLLEIGPITVAINLEPSVMRSNERLQPLIGFRTHRHFPNFSAFTRELWGQFIYLHLAMVADAGGGCWLFRRERHPDLQLLWRCFYYQNELSDRNVISFMLPKFRFIFTYAMSRKNASVQ